MPCFQSLHQRKHLDHVMQWQILIKGSEVNRKRQRYQIWSGLIHLDHPIARLSTFVDTGRLAAQTPLRRRAQTLQSRKGPPQIQQSIDSLVPKYKTLHNKSACSRSNKDLSTFDEFMIHVLHPDSIFLFQTYWTAPVGSSGFSHQYFLLSTICPKYIRCIYAWHWELIWAGTSFQDESMGHIWIAPFELAVCCGVWAAGKRLYIPRARL